MANEQRHEGSRLPETMAVNPGRSLEMVAPLAVEPDNDPDLHHPEIRLGASTLERTLRLAFGEGPEIEDGTLPLRVPRAYVRIEALPIGGLIQQTGLTARGRTAIDEALDRGRQVVLARYEQGELVERDRIVEALRDGHRQDSAAAQVEFVSDLVGWSAEDDEVLQDEKGGDSG